MSPDDRIRLLHMVDAIETATRFSEGRSREDLDNDQMLLFALVRAVEIIGEAATNIAAETRALAPEIPWKEIVGMRMLSTPRN